MLKKSKPHFGTTPARNLIFHHDFDYSIIRTLAKVFCGIIKNLAICD
jgi:hypothetical protein